MDVEHERGYRTGFREYTAGDRKLEIVSGKDYSSNQVYTCSGYDNRRPRSPEHRPQPPFSPPRCSRGRHSSRGGSGAWCFSDPEMKRRRRVASYKAYSIEGKVKESFRKGFRWIKTKCSQLVHGW